VIDNPLDNINNWKTLLLATILDEWGGVEVWEDSIHDYKYVHDSNLEPNLPYFINALKQHESKIQ
jgi:hypothetical protein